MIQNSTKSPGVSYQIWFYMHIETLKILRFLQLKWHFVICWSTPCSFYTPLKIRRKFRPFPKKIGFFFSKWEFFIRCFLLYYVVIYEKPGFKWKCMCTKQGLTQLFRKGGAKQIWPFSIFLPFLKICRITFRIFLPLLFVDQKGRCRCNHAPSLGTALQKFDSYKKCSKSYYRHTYYTCIRTLHPPNAQILIDLNKHLLPNTVNLDFSNETDCLHWGFSVQNGDFICVFN